MIVLGLDAATLGRIRLAPSPTFEALAWLKLVAAGRRHPVFGDPGASARFAMREPEVAMLSTVVSAPHAGYTPDFLTPTPPADRNADALGSQLERIRATPQNRIVDEIGQRFMGDASPPPIRSAMDSGTFASRAVDGLRTFWRHAIADRWDTIATALAVDVLDRSAAMSAGGVGTVLQSLDPTMDWDGAELRIDSPWSMHSRFTDVELVLTPFALGWPRLWLQLEDTEDATIFYPANGIGAAVGPRRRPGLPRLLGTTRARILEDLALPRSTTELSERHRLTQATVSYHLGVLHDAGLVTRSRHRRVVLYRRSEQAASLLGQPATAS
ncbi:MAG TPA: winged helix-turn-helix domain-containing protein [Jiangellaceae bacterium]